MDAALNALADVGKRRQHAGQALIRDRWRWLSPSTKKRLQGAGYSEHGAAPEESDDPDCIEYTLGTLAEAAKATTNFERGQPIPDALRDDVLGSAAEFAVLRQWHCAEFARLAIRAVANHQLAASRSQLYFSGGHPGGEDIAGWKLFRYATGLLIFLPGLPMAIGYGVSFAARGEPFAASLCAAFALAGAIFFLALKSDGEHTPEQIAYREWFAVIYRFGSIVTGHGLAAQLQVMLATGIRVPLVMIDLCAVLSAHSLATDDVVTRS